MLSSLEPDGTGYWIEASTACTIRFAAWVEDGESEATAAEYALSQMLPYDMHIEAGAFITTDSNL